MCLLNAPLHESIAQLSLKHTKRFKLWLKCANFTVLKFLVKSFVVKSKRGDVNDVLSNSDLEQHFKPLGPNRRLVFGEFSFSLGFSEQQGKISKKICILIN